MKEERRAVDLITANGSITPGEFLILDKRTSELDLVELVLTLPNRCFKASAIDCFEALIAIRLQLEPVGLSLICWGACLHVYPSDATRSDGQGETAYRLTIGRFPAVNDLVNVFESGPGLVAATVAEQENFFQVLVR